MSEGEKAKLGAVRLDPRATRADVASPRGAREPLQTLARNELPLSVVRADAAQSADSFARGDSSSDLDESEEADSQTAAQAFNVVVPDPAMALPQAPQAEPVRANAPTPQAAPPPAAAPAPIPQVEFLARAPGEQTEAASISIHHPDLGPIQLEVHRDHGRVEVHAVIESQHAEAVLRANESGIRQGVQQSGMSFSALRVRVRQDEPGSARAVQTRRRRANERE